MMQSLCYVKTIGGLSENVMLRLSSDLLEEKKGFYRRKKFALVQTLSNFEVCKFGRIYHEKFEKLERQDVLDKLRLVCQSFLD